VRFTETALGGACLIEPDRLDDARGFFACVYDRREFEVRGLKLTIAQANVTLSRLRGTIRGLHFQYPPAAQAKLIRCIRGAMFDVIVDLRPESPTFLQHVAVELDGGELKTLYVPERFAHGYQTLKDSTAISYVASDFYAPEAESGLRYDDPRLKLAWPLGIAEISDKDRRWPSLDQTEAELRCRMQA
jgi:dTDP-4-dehydrorhamnose 3,5-epimerase